MRIRTDNKIIDVSNVEYDVQQNIIYTDEIAVKFDFRRTFNQALDNLLTNGYADFAGLEKGVKGENLWME